MLAAQQDMHPLPQETVSIHISYSALDNLVQLVP